MSAPEMLVPFALAGYFVGSLPIAWVVTRVHHGSDLRVLGSGNVGVMNTALSVHRWAALLVFVCEIAKGVLAVIVTRMLDLGEITIDLTALAVIVGTRWSIWLGFTGGRGNTAAMAAIFVISWQTFFAITAIYLLARVLTGSNFLAMRLALLALPLIFGVITGSWWSVLFGAVFSLIFLSTHRPESDDHLRIKEHWQTLWDFITAPPRR